MRPDLFSSSFQSCGPGANDLRLCMDDLLLFRTIWTTVSLSVVLWVTVIGSTGRSVLCFVGVFAVVSWVFSLLVAALTVPYLPIIITACSDWVIRRVQSQSCVAYE